MDLRHVLWRFGHFLEGSITGGRGVDASAQAGFNLTEQVLDIDDFLSHDWGTPRWRKTLALLGFYNSAPAMLASYLACALIIGLSMGGKLGTSFSQEGLLEVAGVQVQAYAPKHIMVLCPLLFWGVLCFWQRLRGLVPGLRPTLCFLDKMCINQSNEADKSAAILCLSGFLKRTRRLVILWSPRYLTRLWCVYEIASWLHLEKDFRQTVDFVPVSLLFGVLPCLAAANCMLPIFVMALEELDPVLYSPVAAGVILFCLVVPIVYVRRLAWDLSALRRQLAEFQVQASECYCCSVGHQAPDGERIACDRELIYQALTKWFPEDPEKSPEVTNLQQTTDDVDANGPMATNADEVPKLPGQDIESSSGPESQSLERFNRFVQEVVAGAVSSSLFSPWGRYKICMLLALPALWYNSMWSCGATALLEAGTDPKEVLRYLLGMAEMAFFLYPGFAMVILRLCSVSNRIGGEASLRGWRCVLWAFLVTFLAVLVVAIQFSAMTITYGLADPAPQIGVMCVEGLIFRALFGFPWSP